jgi:hypothetical protein
MVTGEMTVLPDITAVLFAPVYRGNDGSACSNNSTFTSLNNHLSSMLYHNVVLYIPSDFQLTKYINPV